MMTIGESQYPIRTKLLYHIYTNLLNMSCARTISMLLKQRRNCTIEQKEKANQGGSAP